MRDLRAVVEWDLRDAAIEGLSSDRRFTTAYNAVFQLARIVIACAGYRLTGAGHHQTAFEALEIAMGPTSEELASYFDTCRRKRNQVDYDFTEAATETEAEELLAKAHEFQKLSKLGFLTAIRNCERRAGVGEDGTKTEVGQRPVESAA